MRVIFSALLFRVDFRENRDRKEITESVFEEFTEAASRNYKNKNSSSCVKL